MDRRYFLNFLTAGSSFRTQTSESATRAEITAGLAPYATQLTLDDAYHLLRRYTFAPTKSVADQLVGKTADTAVDMLLGTGSEADPTSPGSWVDIAQENPATVDIVTRGGIESTWKTNFGKLQNWWIDLMRSEAFPATEKLTLFWSGHFTSEFTFDEAFLPPQVLYRQNLMLRKNRLSDLMSFIEEVTLDAGMLVYLGGVLNVKGKPNENYAREVMELFSCGIGWYTEGDIREASRVLTGWKSSLYSDSPAKNGLFNSYFEPRDHDIGAKQYMGQSIPARDDTTNTEFLVRTEEIRKMISILFEYRTDAIAKYISRKLYRYFVYSSPSGSDEAIISEMANIFMQNNFQVRPLLKALLSSQHFFDTANRGVQIKTPAEYVVGFARQLGVSLTTGSAAMGLLEQVLMDPPNVAGWTGYRTWISTKTFPQRMKYAKDLITALSDAQIQTFIKQFPNYNDVNKIVDAMTAYFLPVAVSTSRHDYYVNILINNGQPYEWTSIVNDVATCSVRVRNFLNAIVKAPDFHLC